MIRALGRFLTGVWAHVMAFLRVVQRALAALMLPEGRRAWALVALWGAGVAVLAYAAAAMWLVRDHAGLVFWLGIMAHISVLVAISGFAGLLVKRRITGKVKDLAEFGIDDIEQSE